MKSLTEVLFKTNNAILFLLSDVAAITAAHLSEGPCRILAISTPPKAVFTVKTEKTTCLISCKIYPTHLIVSIHDQQLVLASVAN